MHEFPPPSLRVSKPSLGCPPCKLLHFFCYTFHAPSPGRRPEEGADATGWQVYLQLPEVKQMLAAYDIRQHARKDSAAGGLAVSTYWSNYSASPIGHATASRASRRSSREICSRAARALSEIAQVAQVGETGEMGACPRSSLEELAGAAAHHRAGGTPAQ